MKITIKHRITYKVIIEGEYDSIKDALQKNRGADLSGADLRGADLSGADLRDADLSGADLSGADLRGAKGISWLKAYTLLDYIVEYGMETDGVYFFAYKGVDEVYQSPTQSTKLTYAIRNTIETIEGNPDVFTDCGHGINLCPSVALAQKWGPKVVKVKVHMGDMVCLPINHDKFRVKRCEVIEEVKA